MRYTFFIILSYVLFGCSGQSLNDKKQQIYLNYKLSFESRYTDHFPDSVIAVKSYFVKRNSPELNKIGFYLYEFEVAPKIQDSLTRLFKSNSIANYNWGDSCLLILHPHESVDDSEDVPHVSSFTYRANCLMEKFPIPNFIDLQSPNAKFGITIDETFNIYVLESQAGNYSKDRMTALKSMPSNWTNGFSRGYAVSTKNAVIVYWMLIW